MKENRGGGWMGNRCARALCTLAPACTGLGMMSLPPSLCAAGPPAGCTRVELKGEVNRGQEWRQALGQGWVFRLVPIAPGKAGYSGWDLVVDRDPPAGYPDALLLATPPYESINEREVGTTFGLRAQDAIGWNPRSFHFLTDPAALRESRRLFQTMGGAMGGIGPLSQAPAANSPEAAAMKRLMQINEWASAGQLRILHARLSAGTADAASYAENWALQSAKTPQEASASAKATPRGELDGMSFSVTLWLPGRWKAPPNLQAARSRCSE